MQRRFNLDDLPIPTLEPREKLLQCLEMYEAGVDLQLTTFRRRFPHLSEPELAALLQRWLERSDEP